MERNGRNPMRLRRRTPCVHHEHILAEKQSQKVDLRRIDYHWKDESRNRLWFMHRHTTGRKRRNHQKTKRTKRRK